MKFVDTDGKTWDDIQQDTIASAPAKYRAQLQRMYDADDEVGFDALLQKIYS